MRSAHLLFLSLRGTRSRRLRRGGLTDGLSPYQVHEPGGGAYLKRLCEDLEQIEKLFKEGKSKEEVLEQFKQSLKQQSE
jgi:hypothetical protein